MAKPSLRHLRSTAASLLILVLFLAPMLAACGKKTAPIPPQSVVPTPIKDLAFSLDAQGVSLSWTYPEKTVLGRPVESIAEFEILRAEIPAKDWCGGCPTRYDSSRRIASDAQQPASQEKKKKTARFSDTGLKPGHRYVYAVRTYTEKLYPSAESNAVNFLWESPLAAPAGLAATAGDGRVELSWQPPKALADGSPAAGPISFQVVRSESGKNEFVTLDVPTEAAALTDITVANGQAYDYLVQARREVAGVLAPGLLSQIVTAQPRDSTAPPPPLGLSLAYKNGITLSWQPTQAADLAGYRIYRRCANDPSWTMIGEERSGRTVFTDAQPPSGGRRCAWAVSSIDRESPANESPLSLDSKAQIE